MDDLIEALGKIEAREFKEEHDKKPQIVTTMNDLTGTHIKRYYMVTTESHFIDRHYKRHNSTTMTTAIKRIPPQKFYNTTQIENFISRLNRMANRKIENAEMAILLRTVTGNYPNGRQKPQYYDLVCAIDITKDLGKLPVWEDIRK